MDLLLEERATVGMVSFSQNLDNVAKVLAHPAIMIGSDSIGLSEGVGPKHGKPHPRMYGTFPRVLGEYARDRGLFSLETAVRKMTGMPAERLRFKDRGLLRAGLCRGHRGVRSRDGEGRGDVSGSRTTMPSGSPTSS